MVNFKKAIAGVVAIMMTTCMFTSCGSSGSEKSDKDNKKSNSDDVKKVAANDELDAQVNKLKDFANSNPKAGTVSIKINYDDATTDKTATWADVFAGNSVTKIGGSIGDMSGTSGSESSDTSDNTSHFDFDADASCVWSDSKFSGSFTIFDTKPITLAYDGTNYYLDASAAKDIMSASGSSNATIEPYCTLIKVPKTSVDKVMSSDSSSSDSSSVESEAKQKVSEILNDDVIAELKKLEDKAEYDGADIVIKDLKKSDFDGLSNAVQKAMNKSDTDTDKTSTIVEGDVESESDKNSDENVSVNYKLSYSADKLNQTHIITMSEKDKATITFTISVSDTGNVDFGDYSSAKTIEELSNNQFTADALLQSIFGSVAGSVSESGVNNSGSNMISGDSDSNSDSNSDDYDAFTHDSSFYDSDVAPVNDDF